MDVPGLVVDLGFNGWVSDQKTLDDADAVVIYADGGAGNPAIQKDHLETLARLTAKGVGVAFMHYGVEIPAARGGAELKKWIGGYYEDKFSCNPMWEPHFQTFPDHPITRGVHPFHNRDEWYINMRWADGFSSDKPSVAADGTRFWPILVDKPSDAVRKGPYVAPRGPYPHVVAATGQPEAMMWAVERPDGGRGFGFVGGHSHDNWKNDDQRKVVLNAMVWLAKLEVPATGVESKVADEELNQNLDKKR
jgi:type 1 glutamine amidotransferase